MPLTKLQIAPGIDKQNTEYGAEGKWVDSDNVRFRYGLPEKIGGWAKVSSDALLGATRAVLTWSSLKGTNYAMYGTNKKLYAFITPVCSQARHRWDKVSFRGGSYHSVFINFI